MKAYREQETSHTHRVIDQNTLIFELRKSFYEMMSYPSFQKFGGGGRGQQAKMIFAYTHSCCHTPIAEHVKAT